MWITLIFNSFQESFCTTSARYSSTTSLDKVDSLNPKKLSSSASCYILRPSSTIHSHDFGHNILSKYFGKHSLDRKVSYRQKSKSCSSEISSITNQSSSAEPSASSEASLPGYTIAISPVSSEELSFSSPVPASLPPSRSSGQESLVPDTIEPLKHSLTVPESRGGATGHRRRHRHHSGHHVISREAHFGLSFSHLSGSSMGHQQLEKRPDEAVPDIEPMSGLENRCKSSASKSTESPSPSPVSFAGSPSGSASLPPDDQSGGSSSCSSSGVELDFTRKCTISADSLLLHPEITGACKYPEDEDEDERDEEEDSEEAEGVGDEGDHEAEEMRPELDSEAEKCSQLGERLLNPPTESTVIRRKISGSLSSDQIHKHMMFLNEVTLTTGTRSVSPKMIFTRKYKSEKSSAIGLVGCCTGSGSVDQASSSRASCGTSEEKRKLGVANSVFSGTGRIARLLRRTHSAGFSKDVPSHALFLREKAMPPKSHPPSSPSSVASEPSEKKRGRKQVLGLEDMKQRLRFLRRRHTDSSLQSGNIRPNPEEARKWGESFQYLMRNKYGSTLFKAFLAREFSQENIEFWMACEEYKKVRPGKKSSKARKIYEDFVAFQSPKEINIDGQLRTSILQSLNNPEDSTFDVAQRKIQGMLEQDAYIRFLQSDLYRDLLAPESKQSFPIKCEPSLSGKMSPESSL